MVVTRSEMENRVDSVEQRMNTFEGTLEQIRLMVLEQQARPHVTAEQIRQIILEQPRRNHGRNGRPPRGGYDEEEEEESDRSSLSRESQHRYRRNRGEGRSRFFGSRRRLEIPLFKGEDAYGWLVKIERYFLLNEVRTKDKLDVAMMAMEDRALNWYQWWEEQTSLKTWEEFKIAVMRRFQPGLLHNPLGPLLSLKQKGSVGEYREKFEMMVAPLRREERIMLDSIFLNGLKDEIQAELKLHESQDLAELMDRALLIEEKNEVVTKKGSSWKDRGGTFRLKDPAEAGGSKKESETNQGGGMDKGKGRRLDPAELEERSKKGLCFKCGDKWNREHVCKFKHMSLKLCEDSSEEEVEVERLEENHMAVADRVKELQTLQLSMQSRDGFTSNKSFKVWVEVKGKKLLTLIDSGATSNFIDPKVAAELAVKIVETPTYVIEVGNGEKVKNQGVCEGLEFNMQGVKFSQHFFMMELGGTELVLGMDWLASLGKIEANFGELSLKWEKEGLAYEIKGDSALCVRQSNWKAMLRNLRDEGVGFYVHSREPEALKETGGQEEWEKLLKPFEALYGRRPPVLIRGDTPSSAIDEVNKLTAERNVVLRELQEQLLRAQDVMRSQANKHRRAVGYEVGESVFLKIQPYKMRKLAKRLNKKLSPRYYGPYETIQKIGAVAYKLKLPEDTRVHPVFHASLLKKAVSPSVATQPLPVCINEDWHLEPVPEKILEQRKNEQGGLEALVQWKGLPEFENSWESVDKLQAEFPEFLLEVKENFEGGRIGRFGKVYQRTRKRERKKKKTAGI
ncbi:uncharacterized protein LOC131628242 [Vicia villosa]|uniref:uncharacterized protein LOC131628242 n=1 Tax=Vicia villosa TaxID=3911 RepID=UPI00273AE2F0|nr:uncharacterized protein LOC131628242 [Vicia villosa]XP_058755095.1 uncharacterized protein LOC131628242 [Vicia villosa]XP_058755100.1 uncharacterized protein LOC131628242 [Vicia villosa]XP_058755106.1 uncharacterized protein LOC131628242 [Vicia villosa]XP_058755110.1 uncharacterized protein LOC131628242 [Vicia villosa]